MAAVAMPTQSDASTSAATALPARLDATPSHYAHVTFPLPDKRYVGMLHCQRDPLAATLVTRVVRCDKVLRSSGADKSAKAKAKKGSAATPIEQNAVDDEWQVELADTVLFPEGGGQPSDTGRIVPLVDGQEPSGEAAAVVRQVIRRNLDAVHFVSKPFEVGAQVRLEVDMDRRRDLMDQHTGQHLLSAVLEHEYQADTLSWSLQKYPELNYVELPRNLSPEEIAAVQRRCNDLIDEARPIRVKFELATEETGVQLGEHVPSDYKAGEHGDERPPVQRTVIIEQLDENPCCGTHYPSLSYLRTLYISPNTTSIRGTNTRLYFAVGSSRVLAYLASVQAPARQAALHAGCAIADLPNKVEGLVSSGTDLKRREKRLHAELAQWVAKDLWDRAASQAQSSSSSSSETFAGAPEEDVGGAPKTITGSLLREEDATNSLEFLSTVALELKQRAETQQKQESQEKKKKYVFLLASGATSGSPGAVAAGGAVLIFGTDESAVAASGKRVVEQFGKERVKGGGKGRWQGKVTGRWEKGDDLLLEQIFVAAAAPAGGK